MDENKEESLVHAIQYKEQYDLNSRQNKEWSEFLKLKQQESDKYGASVANRLYEAKEAELVTKFDQQQADLYVRRLEQWETYHDPKSSEKIAQPERLDELQPEARNTKEAFEISRTDMLGKRPESVRTESSKAENPVEKATDVYEELLQKHREKQQDLGIISNVKLEQANPQMEKPFDKINFTIFPKPYTVQERQDEQQREREHLMQDAEKRWDERRDRVTRVLDQQKASHNLNTNLQPEIRTNAEEKKQHEKEQKSTATTKAEFDRSQQQDRERRKEEELNKLKQQRDLQRDRNKERDR